MSKQGSPIQGISITRIEDRKSPAPHKVYAILVTLPVKSWTVFRRYSDFVTLNESLTKDSSMPGPPPSGLPPKNTTRKTLTFLGGFMMQNESIQGGDDMLLEQRREGLELYLRAIVASPIDAWRESQSFKAFIEMPPESSSRTLLRPLPQGGSYVPGSYSLAPEKKNSTYSTNCVHDHSIGNGLTTRTLGAKRPVHESDTTRSLNDNQLMKAQYEQMDSQDSRLDGLAAILRRQKAMGLAINQELLEQNELLENLDHHVDQTEGKMRQATRQMDRLK